MSAMAKNTLFNHAGVPPYQLVFGKLPSEPIDATRSQHLPHLNDPANHTLYLSDLLRCQTTARAAYVQASANAIASRALNSKVRKTFTRFDNGDKVYFYHYPTKTWRGPGSALGQRGKKVVVQHGARAITTHIRSARPAEERFDENWEPKLTYTQERKKNRDLYVDIFNPASKLSNHFAPEDNVSSSHNDPSPRAFEAESMTASASPDREITPHAAQPRISRELRNLQMTPLSPTARPSWRERIQRVKVVVLEGSDIELHKSAIIKAEKKEMGSWSSNKAYDRVKRGNFKTLKTRWACAMKQMGAAKARCVIKGYADPAKYIVGKESPTAERVGIRMVIHIGLRNNWEIRKIDAQAALLQSHILKRRAYIEPPKHHERNADIAWKLNKATYGLVGASREWHDTLAPILINLGMHQSKLGSSLFFYKTSSKLHGMVVAHVDDLLLGGDEIFYRKVVRPFKNHFKIKEDLSNDFVCLGVDMKLSNDCWRLTQNQRISGIPMLLMEGKAAVTSPLNENEISQHRAIIGKLQWASNNARPDIAASASLLAQRISGCKALDGLDLNKLVKKAKSTKHEIKFNPMQNDAELIVCSDSAFGSRADGASQMGCYAVLRDVVTLDSNVIYWCSKKPKRVARSTLAAEAMAFSECLDITHHARSMHLELTGSILPTSIIAGCKPSCDAARAINMARERRLRVEIACIRECLKIDGMNIIWACAEEQLADELTKLKKVSDIASQLKTGVLKKLIKHETCQLKR